MPTKMQESDMVLELLLSLRQGEQRFNDIHNWTIHVDKGIAETVEPNVLNSLSHFGKAASIISFIQQKDQEAIDSLMKLHKRADWEEVRNRKAGLNGAIQGVDTNDTLLFESAIDRQLLSKLEEWRQTITHMDFSTMYDESEEEHYLEEWSNERDFLEYTAIGIEIIQAEYPYFRRLKNLFKYLEGLKEADVRFREVLGNRRDIRHWADPVLWWRKPAKR